MCAYVCISISFHFLVKYYYRHVYTHRFINTLFTLVCCRCCCCCYFWFEYIKNRLYPRKKIMEICIWPFFCLASPSHLWLNENLLVLQAFYLSFLSLPLLFFAVLLCISLRERIKRPKASKRTWIELYSFFSFLFLLSIDDDGDINNNFESIVLNANNPNMSTLRHNMLEIY